MKQTIKIFLTLILTFSFFGCESDLKLSGNYNTCERGLYGELFLKNDSMRLATSMEFVSEWRKYEIKNDSFYHFSFGEPVFRVAKINFIENNAFELIYPKDSVRYIFNKMNIKIDNNITYEQFFDNFYKRKQEIDCFKESER
ncbi:hypothetical protein ACFQ1Q_12760 [Winogradskyella litorisediminis]|uniref:Lipoprotein n=1 Tax=Winogradskyella litorisediminis TaxID=1156618 RepID=A0ABW3NCU1_9FLAO